MQVPGWLNQGLSMSTFVRTREMVVNYAREGRSRDFGKMSKVHEIVEKWKQLEPVYLGEIVAC